MIAYCLLLCNTMLATPKWHDDFQEAKNVAFRENKTLLVAFLGPNWCLFSDQLEEEILATSNFLQNVGKDFVLVKIDIPEDFEEKEFMGKELKEQFQIEECPALVLAEPSGEEIAKLSYLPIDKQEFAATIKETLEDYRNLSRISKKELEKLKEEELKTLYAKAGRLADSRFRNAILDQGLKTNRSPYFLLEKYSKLVTSGKISSWKIHSLRKRIIASDPQNSQGSQRNMAVMDFEALAHVKKPQKAEIVLSPLLTYLKDFGKKDLENAWRIEMKISQYFFTQNRAEDALRHAKASYAIAPEEKKGEIAKSIEYLKHYAQ